MLNMPTNDTLKSVVRSSAIFPSNEECGIREVWKHNLEEEFQIIRMIVQKYQYVAVDTEFPGNVARPIGQFCNAGDYHYQMLRLNVEILKVIQVGLSFMDEDGNGPPGYSTWQFNFKYKLQMEMSAQRSIDLLLDSGLAFDKHANDGIDPFDFAELLITSGIILMDDIKFITFHSDFDFGYILRLLRNERLPEDQEQFFELVRLYFPNIYDVKCLVKPYTKFKGAGLQEVADQLNVHRIGTPHQAGSDALLTGMIFFKMRQVYYNNGLPDEIYNGMIYGLSSLKDITMDKENDKDNKQVE